MPRNLTKKKIIFEENMHFVDFAKNNHLRQILTVL